MVATALYTGLVFLFTFVLIYLRFVGAKSSHPKLPPSGPRPLPVIGHLHLLRMPLHQTLARISAKHGPLLLLRFGARPVLVVSSPAYAEECYTKNDIVFANRPIVDSARHLTYNYTTLGSAPYGPHWRSLRRVTTSEIFSTSRVTALSFIRTVEVHSLLRELLRVPAAAAAASDGFRTVEMKSKLSELMFNLIMQMSAGKRYYGKSATADPEEGGRFRRIVKEVFHLGGVSNPEDFLPFMKWVGVGGLHKRLQRVEEEMDGLFQDMVDERRKWRISHREAVDGDEKTKTVLDIMLSLQESDPGSFTDEVIKGIILVLITAGTDTSSGTMEWVMSLLLNHPEAMKKAIAEIEAQVGRDRLVTESDLPNLPYLHNVIKETLRLFPPGPLLVPHQSSADSTVGGYHVPGGAMILINAYAMNRDPKTWEDAAEFKPERFEGGEVEGYKFIPFGAGRRRCPGDVMALRMVGLTLGCLLQCFEWKRVGEKEVDLTEGGGLTLPKAVPLEAMYKPRKDMIEVLSRL